MADNIATIDLPASLESTDRGAKFWNNSSTEMKFSVERQWIKGVRAAKRKPDYGMAGFLLTWPEFPGLPYYTREIKLQNVLHALLANV